jgi:uncharacterized protein YbjT (DUF2867 family)
VTVANRALVIGATGMLGEPVARRLAEDGWQVCVGSRDPDKARARLGDGFEYARCDVERPDSLADAMRGCSTVHLNLYRPGDPWLEKRGATAVARVAREAGVARVGYISGASVVEENCWFEGTRAKHEAEQALRDSGVGYSIFRATWFMEALPKFVQGDRAIVIGKQPQRWHWLAARDYARMVAAAYGSPGAAGRELFLWGPEALTMEDALRRYCAQRAPGARVTHIPFWMAGLIARVQRKAELQAVLPFLRYCEKVTEAGSPDEANRLLGAPETTLREWCAS